MAQTQTVSRRNSTPRNSAAETKTEEKIMNSTNAARIEDQEVQQEVAGEAQAVAEPVKTVSRNFGADKDKFTLDLPVKYGQGHVLTEVEAACLNLYCFERFASNVNAQLKDGKEHTPSDILKMWSEYAPGAPRERGDNEEEINYKAALRVAGELVAAQGKTLPRGGGRKGTNGYVSEEQAKAARDQIVAKVLASEKEATKARLAFFVEQVRAEEEAKRAEAKAKAEAKKAGQTKIAGAAELDV